MDEYQKVKEIIEKAKQGDHQAFGELYNLYYRPIYKYLYFRTGSKDNAEDLVQEVFLKIYNNLYKFSHGPNPPLAYFYTIARNSLIDWKRKKINKNDFNTGEIEDVADSSPDSEAMYVQSEQIGKVYEALRELEDEQREIIIWKFINGYSNKEIAEITGKKEESIRQIQSRGLKKLREIFNKKYEGE